MKILIESFLITLLTLQIYAQNLVDYKITAALDVQSKQINVNSIISYTNLHNDLNNLYLKLYYNIYDQEYIEQDEVSKSFKNVIIKKLEIIYEDKNILDSFEVEKTILKISLKNMIKKNSEVKILIDVIENIPPEGNRVGYYNDNFSLGHWYPAICVYDKYGWNLDQFLGTGEFYEEFANYDCEFLIPESHYIFSTGKIQNADEVYDKNTIDLLNFSGNKDTTIKVLVLDAKKNEAASKFKSWKVKANNVRDFSVCIFNDFNWIYSIEKNIKVHLVYPQNLNKYYEDEGIRASKFAMKYFSEKIGEYKLENLYVTVGGSGSGMEYSGIVFIGRNLSGGILGNITTNTIIHEICHNWFPMLINTNEVKYAFQDEGVATYFTTKAVEEFFRSKDYMLNVPDYVDRFLYNPNTRIADHSLIINNTLTNIEEPIMTHSEEYISADNYAINSYQKTAHILFMLEYLLGKETFEDFWKTYYNQFANKLVYPEDFFNLLSESYKQKTGKDLRWFIDQWFYKCYKLDYGLKNYFVKNEDDKFKLHLSIEKIEKAIMPIEIEIRFADNSKDYFRVSEENFLLGKDVIDLDFTYEKEPVAIELDPNKILLDINRMNNTNDLSKKIKLNIIPRLDVVQDPFNYTINLFPSAAYNIYDGIKIGFMVYGGQIRDRYEFDFHFLHSLKFQDNSMGGYFKFKHRIPLLGRDAFIKLYFFDYEGRKGYNLGVSKEFKNYNKKIKVDISLNHFNAYNDLYFNRNIYDELYYNNVSFNPIESVRYKQRNYLYFLFNTAYFLTSTKNSFMAEFDVDAGYVKAEEYFLNSNSFLTENKIYQKYSLSLVQEFFITDYLLFRLREYLGYSPGIIPKAKSFYLSKIDPIDEYYQPVYRTAGYIPLDWKNKYTTSFGGGYLRGYFNQNIFSNNVISFNSEFSLSNILKNLNILRNIFNVVNINAFFDAGNVVDKFEKIDLTNFKTDAGISISIPMVFSINNALKSERVAPLEKYGIKEIRFDFPLFVSHPLRNEKKFEFRWSFGFSSPLNF